MEILQQTLNQMDSRFSSNEFADRAKKNGLLQKEINNGIISAFLHSNAMQANSRRSWVKKDQNDDLEKAIKFVKSKGFRVLKKVEEWKEI